MADYTYKRGDVGQEIVVELWEELVSETIDTSTGDITETATWQRIALVSGDTVKLLLKDYTNGVLGAAVGGGACTISNMPLSEVTYTLVTADLNTARTWAVEFEITKATGEVITVPDEPDAPHQRTIPYLTLDVLPDLG